MIHSRREQTLLLVGHGSRLGPDASAPVYAHAERIRERHIFDEVREAFWKEAPALRHGLSLVRGDDVFVVPIFLAEGYFTGEVVPRELGLDGRLTRRGSRLIRYCPPVGAHPRMAALVLRRAARTAGLSAAERRQAALVVIGHGTERSPTSRGTVQRVAARLRARADFGAVACGFLDEEPRIERVVQRITARQIVLVPFFVAEGWHTRETIPRQLGLAGTRTLRNGQTLWCTPPVGTHPEVARIAVELVCRAGARPGRRADASHWRTEGTMRTDPGVTPAVAPMMPKDAEVVP